MGGSSKKGGDTQEIPKIDPSALIQQAIQANRVNVATPYGSQQYSTDANGNTTLSSSLTPEMQALLSKQMAAAGAAPAQYTLPGQNASVLNGLNTRLDQRYAIGLPPPASGSTPGTGGGSVPVTPTRPPTVPAPPRPPVAAPVRPPTGSSGAPASSGNFMGGGEVFGGGMCVVSDSYLPGKVRASDVMVRDYYPCHLPVIGFHDAEVTYRGNVIERDCVKLTTDKGAVLRLSATTPFNRPSATADLKEGDYDYAPDMLGRAVFVLTPTGHEIQVVTAVDDIGKHPVVPISFGGKSFAAGDTPEALIYSHNIYKDPNANPQLMGGGFGGYSDFMQEGGQLQGSIDASRANDIAGGGTGAYSDGSQPYSGPGGYLGSGSYAGMGAGLAAANADKPPAGAPPAITGMGVPQIGRDLGSVDIAAPGTTQPGSTTGKSWMDSKYAKLAAALLGPGAAIALGAANKYRHRNDP